MKNLLCASISAAALAACTPQPASIEVKLPKEAVQSATAGADLPAFRRAGETVELRASAFDAEHIFMGPATVTWSSADPKVAVVDDKGLVTVAGSGETDIIAAGVGYETPLEGRFKVRARIVTSVTIVPPAGFKKVGIGTEVALVAEVKDERGVAVQDALVQWSCPDHGVWVDAKGKISGAAVGESTVMASAEGRSGTLTFEVTER